MKVAAAILVLSAVGVALADDPKKDDAELLKGKWKVVSITVGGDAVAGDDIKNFICSFDGKGYTNVVSGETIEEGSYSIDVTKSPKTIDFEIKKGPDQGKKQPSVYKLDGDKLTIVAPPAGTKDRPTSLKVEKGSQIFEIVLERVKP